MTRPVRIDGSLGEGGGQVVRTAIALAALSGRALRIDKIRAGRRVPGLAAQHVTAIRALAAICAADLAGDAIGSASLVFVPTRAPLAGDYAFDVSLAREGGSAGSVALVLQTLAAPLALTSGQSLVRITGGTHVPGAPVFEYLAEVWAPALASMGLAIDVSLQRTGWYPAGGGAITAKIHPCDTAPRPFVATTADGGRHVTGLAVAANLPAHIPQRMADRAMRLLASHNLATDIVPRRVTADCPGAAIFLCLRQQQATAGFSALGQPGKPAEAVADEAVDLLLGHARISSVCDVHLADQLLLPAALASGESRFTTPSATRHLRTNAAVIEAFDMARIGVEETGAGPTLICVKPAGAPQCAS